MKHLTPIAREQRSFRTLLGAVLTVAAPATASRAWRRARRISFIEASDL